MQLQETFQMKQRIHKPIENIDKNLDEADRTMFFKHSLSDKNAFKKTKHTQA